MKVAILSIVLFFVHCSRGDVYLRARNDRGPGMLCKNCLTHEKIFLTTFNYLQGATKSGVECLKSVESIYFTNELSQQTQKLTIFISSNLTLPSADISRSYLRDLHVRFNEKGKTNNYQLRIITKKSKTDAANEPKSREPVLSDLYVVVSASLQNVISILLCVCFSVSQHLILIFRDSL